jgi:hypothetical protein
MQSRADAVNLASAQGKPMFLPGETCYRAEKQPCSREQIEIAGVSRGHSTVFFLREGLNNEKDEYDEQFVG